MSAARLITMVAGLVLALAAHAHSYKVGSLSIGHPYARVTVAGQTTGGGFMSIANAGAADRLVAASSPVCERVEMHSMRLDGDVMRMRQLESVDLPAGKTVEFGPRGLHFMLVGLKAPLKAGEKFPLKLSFEKAGELTVEVHVEPVPSAAPSANPAAVHEHKH